MSKAVQSSRKPTTRAVTLATFLVAGAVASTPTMASGQDLTHSVDAVTFFDEEERFVLSIVPLVGYEERTGAFPALSVAFGRLFGSHFLLEGVTTARLMPPFHVSMGPRGSVHFGGALLNFSVNTSPMVLVVPETREVGLGFTWGVDLSLRLDSHNALKLQGDIDLIFDELGFDRTRPIYYGGVGWMFSF